MNSACAPVPLDDLTSPEEFADRQKRRRRWLVLLVFTVLAVGAIFAAKPILHAAKAWQARRAAQEAERLTSEHRWLEAKNKVQDAMQLWPNEPASRRAAAIFLARVGNSREASEFWKQVELARPLTTEEQREDAEVLVAIGQTELAETHLRKAWPVGQEGTPADWEIGMRIAGQRNAAPEAMSLARRLLASRAATTHQRLDAALTLLSAGDQTAAPTEALTELQALSQNQQSAESLDALLILARWASATASAGKPTASVKVPVPALPELIDRIESHPLAKIQHRLLALDLRIALEPGRRDEWIGAAVKRFAGTKEDTDLVTLGSWLYGKGEFLRVLDVIPANRATDDRALFFQRLDALGALNRWGEIRAALQSRQIVIDPMVEQMYLARCAEKLGELQVRDVRWDAAVDAAGSNPEKLLQLGHYAEKSGQAAVSEKAFRAAIQAAPESRDAYGALLGALESAGKTRQLRETLQNVLKLWPQDAAARNDAAYLDALLGVNLRAALDTARELVREEPASLPHRVTLALAELRSGHDLGALDAFKGIDARQAAVQPRQRAVFAAVLWATNYSQEARDALRNLPRERLLPEERDLVRAIDQAGAESH